jgi:hypothetical protein
MKNVEETNAHAGGVSESLVLNLQLGSWTDVTKMRLITGIINAACV